MISETECLATSTPTLEFTEDLKFGLQCDCDWLRAAGNYTFDDTAITATDTLQGGNITQIFTFADGYLTKTKEVQGWTLEFKFKKISN